MTSKRSWIGRLILLGAGLGLGGNLLYRTEIAYLYKEADLSTRPIFDPFGLKYAQLWQSDSQVRGWVVDMQPPPRRPGVKRVIAVGDSLTWGLGVKWGEAWPAQLMAALPDTEVYNLGMCGYDAEQGVTLITSKVEEWQPDLVVFGHYPNDVAPTYLMFGAYDEKPVFVGTNIPPEARMMPEALSLWLVARSAWFREVQAAKLARVLASGVTPAVPEGWYDRQLTSLREWSDRSGIPVLTLAIPDHTQADPKRCAEFISEKDCQDQAEGYARITDSLTQAGLDWVDGQAIYGATGLPHFMGGDRDSGHPTPEGHTVLAQGLAPTVAARLGK